MDAAELSRRIAAEYHRGAVEGGHDPWKPLEFAIKEANRRDIDVEAAAPGASVLGKGHATYLPADQLIVYENVGSDFDKAFLIAHEIGHSELGDDPEGSEGFRIDPARCAEASPVGFDRVVDYGRRQRREVQMDLFAREFLLPREFVRKLHLESNLSATDIANKLGAPFEVVAQQLLDALLLPILEEEPKKEPVERRPNELQLEAAKHRGSAFLLEAGPGTGKTQTLTARVESLLADGVDPRGILLLTFSNKAAGEMFERIAKKHKEAAAAMWIGTFHAFGLDIIRRFHAEAGLPKDPRMLDRTEAVELIEHEFPRLGLVHYQDLYDPTDNIVNILTAISRAKDEVVDKERYAELAQSMIRRAATEVERKAGEEALEVAKVYEAYEKLKRDAGCVDFGDLVSLPVRLLESNEAIRLHLQTKYPHVLVDEYQDVNRSSVRLLAALRKSGENLWAVGDAKQSIYRFRGASSFNMGRFGKGDFPGGQRGRLKKNYRSVKEVVDLFSHFGVGMKVGDADSSLDSERGVGGHTPMLLTTGSKSEQASALATNIEVMRAAGHPYRSQVILCTGNDKLSELGEDLENKGIPVLFLGSLFERPEIRDLFALLGMLVDRRATGLIRVACWPEFQMQIDDVAKVIDYFRANETPPGEWIKGAHRVPGISAESVSVLQNVARSLDGFDANSKPWDVLAKVLLDRTRTAAGICLSEKVKDRTRGIAIWQLMNFLRVQPSAKGLPIARTLERVRRLLRLGDDRDLRQLPLAAQGIDAVRIMTIHGSKGLEFPVVHLPGFNQGTIPRTARSQACPPPDGMVEGDSGKSLDLLKIGHEEEQECLFYVAMSRTRDHFFAYAITHRENGNSWSFSPYLVRLGTILPQKPADVNHKFSKTADPGNVKLEVDGRLKFSGEEIRLYEKCPRRFFYTHVMKIGGRRSVTPFMQMHEAVRNVYRAAIEGAVAIHDPEVLEKHLADAFKAEGLEGHGYANDYRQLALPMLRYFISIREGHTPEKPTALSLTFQDEHIVVLPDDVLVGVDGRRTLRRIKTGHHSSSHAEDLDSAAFMLAARQAFPEAKAELVYLSDQKSEPLVMTEAKLQNRKKKLSNYLTDIRLGVFPAEPSSHSCPACPAFFVCGSVPPGVLLKKF